MPKSDNDTVIAELIASVREFLRERDWEKFHNPKDLAESICIEAAELLQLFQWTRPEEAAKLKTDSHKMTRLKEELADVLIYCLSMANTLNIDLTTTITEKLKQNQKKYRADQYRGKAP